MTNANINLATHVLQNMMVWENYTQTDLCEHGSIIEYYF